MSMSVTNKGGQTSIYPYEGPMPTSEIVASSDIERETGFSSDLLRKWRQRFGFPNFLPAGQPTRSYSRQTVNQLLLIKRLLEAGFRPAQLVGKSHAELDALCQNFASTNVDTTAISPTTKEVIERLKQCDLSGIQRCLAKDRATKTLADYLSQTVAPLIVGLGEAWISGGIEVFHEHLLTSELQRQLHAELLALQAKPGLPRILFATVTDEHHGLGLLMAETALADQGAPHANLGVNTPLREIKMAANAWHADVVAVSFSLAYPQRRLNPTLMHLRRQLPAHIELWSGGSGVASIRRPPTGVKVFVTLEDAVSNLRNLIERQRGTSSAALNG